MYVVSEEPGAPRLRVCVCHHTGTYFHGYGDPGWSMKVGLLQTSLCALITALCVSSCESGKEGQREWDDNAELMGEKMNVWEPKNSKNGAQGNEERRQDGEWL